MITHTTRRDSIAEVTPERSRRPVGEHPAASTALGVARFGSGTHRAVQQVRSFERDFVVDLAMLALAIAAERVTATLAGLPSPGLIWLATFPALFVALMGSRGMYRSRLSASLLEDLRTVVAAAAVAVMTLTFFATLAGPEADIAGQAVRTWMFAVAYVMAGRTGVRAADAAAARRGEAGRATLIIGAGQVGHMLARRMLAHPEQGLRPVGFLDADPLDVPDPAPIPVLCSPDDPEKVAAMVRWHGIEQAILGFSRSDHDADLAIARELIEIGVSVAVVPRLFEGIPDDVALDRVGGIPLMAIHPSRPDSAAIKFRYAAERLLGTLLLILIVPLLAVLSLGVLVSLGRPVLFRQERVGRDGKRFRMLKFRSMREPSVPQAGLSGDVEVAVRSGLGPGGVEGDDDRRTRFGTFLRKTSLDELPQLINVARGEMSLIGPRPERPQFADDFSSSIRRYDDRHRVKAGLTGWAQVNGLRGRTSIADRAEFDNYYVENWSPWLDIKIALMTLVEVFRGRAE